MDEQLMNDGKEAALYAAQFLDQKKAQDILVLDLKEISDITRYFVIATGQVSKQVKALSDYLQHELKQKGIRPYHRDGDHGSDWIVLDYGDLIVHIFEPESRRYYGLEKLWGDAEELDWCSA